MMDEPILSEFARDFTEALFDFCDAPAPNPNFTAQLEQRLLERQASAGLAPQPAPASPMRWCVQFLRTLRSRRWQYAAIALLVALVIALFAIGPQRVLAQVQRWLNYVPGIGFVNLDETRVLAGPVEIRRENTTVRVEQVIAGPERTQITFSLPGFAASDLPGPVASAGQADFVASLVLEDGSRVEPKRWEIGFGSGKLEFPALPAGANRVTLLIPRLPLVSEGVLPENWEIPLTLIPASGEVGSSLFPQPYSPADARASHHGVTLSVLNVAQTASDTAVQYQLEWGNPDWEFRGNLSMDRMPELRDNLGHVYWERPRSNSSVAVVAIPADAALAAPTPTGPSHTDTLVFPELSLSASQAKLWVDSVQFFAPAEGTFQLDLGDHPQVGDAWPLDLDLEVAGNPVHLTGATLRTETIQMRDGQTEQHTFLEFELDPLEARDGIRLASFDITNPDQGWYGTIGRNFFNGDIVYTGRLNFPSEKIPAGKIDLQVTGCELLVYGPWEASLNTPGTDPENAAQPVRFAPQSAVQPENGVRPVVEEVFLSDRLTAIRLGAAHLPPGAAFVRALSQDPAAFDPYRTTSTLYLTDNWARQYDAGRNEVFIRSGGPDAIHNPRWTFFPAMQSLAQNVTLHIPGMEVALPGKAEFSIDVPPDLAFHTEEYSTKAIGGGGSLRDVTRIRVASDPWPVSINLELAGYQLHFTQAQVLHEENADPPYQLILTGEPPANGPEGFRLNALRFARVQRPDGTTIQIDPNLRDSGLMPFPNGAVSPVAQGAKQLMTWILLDVTAANLVDLLPGRYHAEVDDITVYVPGPWKVQFSVSGR